MQRFYETVIDTLTGAAVSGAQCWLLNGDGSVATIWQDAAGTIRADNPLVSDSNGFVAAYVPDGVYTLDFRAAGVSLRTVEGVPIFDLADMRADIDAVVANLAAEVSDRTTAINDEATARANAVAAEATARGNADTALNNAIAALDADTYSKAEVDALIPVVPTRYYKCGSFAVANILASEILMDHQVAEANTLQANFAGSVVAVGTPPAADFALDVQYDGASIGTITVHSDGTWTGATTGGTAKALAANHYFTVVAPAGVDASIARLRFTFKGTI